MMAKVKAALFSSLTSMELFSPSSTQAGLAVMDAFSGSGAVGIEALSRIPEVDLPIKTSCFFVDLSPDCVNTVTSNLERLKFPEAFKKNVIEGDVLDVLNNPLRYGIDLDEATSSVSVALSDKPQILSRLEY
jgi:16S rRNA G966 N2-methylase RsmD